MPKQYVLFGRPVPRLGTRHLSLLLVTISLFAVFSLIFTLPSSGIPGPSLQVADHKFSMPKFSKSPWLNKVNPFKHPSHEPPRQKNDTYGESRWYSDWKWLSMPFSSSITLDENRLVLPMMKQRPPIYCYYDDTIDKVKAEKNAQSELLLTWRRAWWAKGFKPIILSSAEAMNNPMYEELQRHTADMDPFLKTDLMRWLAWENMGGGLLSHYLLFPMGSHEDPLLAYLRRGEFPKLTRWKDLDDGLFAGPKADIAAVIKLAMASPHLKVVKGLLAAIDYDKNDSPFTVDDTPASLAFYSAAIIDTKYHKVADVITNARADGLKQLNQLITSHLHLTWQNLFSDGIAVVKPLPHHTTHMITPGYELATRLTHCPASPMPTSCPPNRPNCAPCVSSHPLKIGTPAHYRNTSSTLYTIGTVPHPYTAQTLNSMREKIDIRWIRRESDRDAWVTDLTKELCGTGVSGAPRVLRFKEAVASDYGSSHSVWFLAERELPDELDWHFGFAIPTADTWADEGRSETPVPGPERRPPPPPHDLKDGPLATPEELKLEPGLLARAKHVVGISPKSGTKASTKPTKEEVTIREAVEAWNLADTEAWRFARAYLARNTMERKKWEEEEAKYAGGVGSEKGRRSGWGERWLDKED
ncbi:hypothetical protein QBC46DRAFT_374445 [Diplogelasinospora grovesii]|uniref:Uncharacterized protein n=1 Tax=Diplogelasinospora grovesii TaxID=303347 RepID=A0AAN6NFE8_9PEZI|nr:hypothetical protein QBC46DRAFT_374445 [Diplogelasinospora grovesii]